MLDLDQSDALRQRLLAAGAFLALVFLGGTAGYYALSHAYLPAGTRWSLADCAYMTVISISTVGYGEIIDVARVPFGRLLTASIIFSGLGVAVYFASTLTTFLIEGEFQQFRKRRKMKQQIAKIQDHIIVCGIGTSGFHVVTELVATRWPFVCIDIVPERIERVHEQPGGSAVAGIVGDATDDEVLREAGIERARGIISALSSDKDNLFVVISARQLNPKLKIVVKAVDIGTADKLRRAGADSVVTPAYIGGIRMVSEMIRPQVTEFLDLMLRDKDKNLRIEEVTLPPNSALVGKLLSEARIREQTNVLIVAVRTAPAGTFLYNPGPQLKLAEGMSLIVLGETDSVLRLRRALGQGSGPARERVVPPDAA